MKKWREQKKKNTVIEVTERSGELSMPPTRLHRKRLTYILDQMKGNMKNSSLKILKTDVQKLLKICLKYIKNKLGPARKCKTTYQRLI